MFCHIYSVARSLYNGHVHMQLLCVLYVYSLALAPQYHAFSSILYTIIYSVNMW